MPALKPTSYVARIVWLGQVPNRKASLRAVPIVHVDADFDGFPGEDHAGVTRPACVRVKAQHARGTIIRNVRQLSVISAEQLAETAADMGLEAIDPALLGASMVVEGIPDFTHVPPSSRFQAPSGATLVVDMENRPCSLPAREVEREAEGFGARYKPSASWMFGGYINYMDLGKSKIEAERFGGDFDENRAIQIMANFSWIF